MTPIAKIIPMLAALAAIPVMAAAQADPHAGHHPPEAAAPATPPAATPGAPQAQVPGCPMMSGGMMGGQKPADGAAAQGMGGKGAMGGAPGQMMAGKDKTMMQQCMTAAAAAPDAKPGAMPSAPSKKQ
jgi:hypothetical protein